MSENAWLNSVSDDELAALIPSRAVRTKDLELAAKIVLEETTKSLIVRQATITALKKAPKKAAAKKAANGHGHAKAVVKKAAKKASKKVATQKPNLWSLTKKEFHLLICTNDKKYAAIRTQLNKASGPSTVVIVATIASAIGSSLGTAAGAITGLVAVLLRTLLSLGTNIACQYFAMP